MWVVQQEGERWSARGCRIIGQRVTREVQHLRVKQLRDINLANAFHSSGFRELKMVGVGNRLSALQRTRRSQFLFRNKRLPVRAGDVAFDKWFTRGAAAMPFGHAAFHRADIGIIPHRGKDGRQPAEQQRKHYRRCGQSGEDPFYSVQIHCVMIYADCKTDAEFAFDGTLLGRQPISPYRDMSIAAEGEHTPC